MARRLVLRLGVIGVVKGAVDSCATSGGALFHLIGFAWAGRTEAKVVRGNSTYFVPLGFSIVSVLVWRTSKRSRQHS